MSLAALVLAFAFQQAPTAPPDRIAPQTHDSKQIYVMACVKCHGEDGRGDTEKGRKLKVPDFTSAKWSDETSDKEIRETIRSGTKDKKGNVRMPGFGARLTAAQVEALREYVRSFVKR